MIAPENRTHEYNGSYEGEHLNRIAFPLGGIGAGMICLEGNGALSHFSLRHKPNFLREPLVFSAICIKGEKDTARVLEGPLPERKARGRRIGGSLPWLGQISYRLPRFRDCTFSARFPFATARLADPDIPLDVEVTGWSPFTPPDSENSSLPVCGLRLTLRNSSSSKVDAVYSFHAENLIKVDGQDGQVSTGSNSFILSQSGSEEEPWNEGYFCAAIDDAEVRADGAWYRSGWSSDTLLMLWKGIEQGYCGSKPPHVEGRPSPGASLYLPLALKQGETRTIHVQLSWYVPDSGFNTERLHYYGEPTPERPSYKPWYAGRFGGIDAVAEYWRESFDSLLARTEGFADCFYDSDLPPEVIEAVGANLTILKSPTIMRQHDGRIWFWEGSNDEDHFCFGSCTHVWNYAQAMAHLFPDLERSLRDTEFNEALQENGLQSMRVPLPIRAAPAFAMFARSGPTPAADGQLGGILKTYRDWRISGDTEWLRSLWPKVMKSLDFSISCWDPRHTGLPEEPQHSTYDNDFWGPNGMCGTSYLGALKAGYLMGKALGEDLAWYGELYEKGRKRLESELFGGEYFEQRVMWEELDATNPVDEIDQEGKPANAPEMFELLRREGPLYQYATGCLSDGVLGVWMAAVAGIDDVVDREKVRRHLLSVHRYNLRRNLLGNFGTIGGEGDIGPESGLLTCTWPKGGKPSIPLMFDYEVWPGIEYQVASHLMMLGCVEEGLEIVRCVRDRFDGRYGNPFDETEHPHWYVRILSSYSLLQGLTGIRYDAVEKTLYVQPRLEGDFRAFLCTATGYGTAGVKDGKEFLDVKSGRIDVEKVVHTRP